MFMILDGYRTHEGSRLLRERQNETAVGMTDELLRERRWNTDGHGTAPLRIKVSP